MLGPNLNFWLENQIKYKADWSNTCILIILCMEKLPLVVTQSLFYCSNTTKHLQWPLFKFLDFLFENEVLGYFDCYQVKPSSTFLSSLKQSKLRIKIVLINITNGMTAADS